MARTTIQFRRKVRELEAKRDKLLEMNTRNKTELSKVRAELTSMRKQGAK